MVRLEDCGLSLPVGFLTFLASRPPQGRLPYCRGLSGKELNSSEEPMSLIYGAIGQTLTCLPLQLSHPSSAQCPWSPAGVSEPHLLCFQVGYWPPGQHREDAALEPEPALQITGSSLRFLRALWVTKYSPLPGLDHAVPTWDHFTIN